MFGDYVFEQSSAQYVDHILLLDDENLNSRTNYISTFSAHGFEVVVYTNDLDFRIKYEEKLETPSTKLAIIAQSYQYIPYDVFRRLNVYKVALESLFSRLNTELLRDKDRADLDLLCAVYRTNFDDLKQKRETEIYLKREVYSKDNVEKYLRRNFEILVEKASNIKKCNDWFNIAEEKASIDVMAAQYDINLDTQNINRLFQEYVLTYFGKLSQNIDKASPVLVSKAMDYINEHSDKFIIVVMDGMSEFDWKIISMSFDGIAYEKTSMFAMIPSTTSVSRQCLLSGKYPIQLLDPWTQKKEEKEFIARAKALGFKDKQIGYKRGYDAQFDSFVRCGTVIINDVDDMVHAQTQSRLGMYNGITLLANQKKLLNMAKRFLAEGYDVYITADHGNTPCIGLGRLKGTGVEVETRSQRMLVLRDFADTDRLKEKFNLIEYPKYYLPKEYDYLICDIGDSFDIKDDDVMTHGGISLDEVIIPFIKIKAV